MAIIKEFKEFAIKGNVIDLAVGVIIGGAFNKIVSSLVGDMIMPPIGVLINNVNFSDLKWVISHKQDGSPISLNYGTFVQNIFEFLIISFTIFLLIKLINKLRRKEPVSPPPPPKQEILLTEIRDLLREQKKSA